VPEPKFIFNLSLCQNNFPNLWKQAAIGPILKKRKTHSFGNYKALNNQLKQINSLLEICSKSMSV
jgi:hypothetical protein